MSPYSCHLLHKLICTFCRRSWANLWTGRGRRRSFSQRTACQSPMWRRLATPTRCPSSPQSPIKPCASFFAASSRPNQQHMTWEKLLSTKLFHRPFLIQSSSTMLSTCSRIINFGGAGGDGGVRGGNPGGAAGARRAEQLDAGVPEPRRPRRVAQALHRRVHSVRKPVVASRSHKHMQAPCAAAPALLLAVPERRATGSAMVITCHHANCTVLPRWLDP